MSSNGDVILRQWEMLRRIPREPRRLSTKDLAEHLQSSGYKVSLRSIQRDLVNLSTIFGYTSELEGRTSYWFWPQAMAALDLPGMDSPTALVFTLAEKHLTPVLPSGVIEALEPYFRRALEILSKGTPGKLGEWQRRIKVINRGPALTPPKVDPKIQYAISDALLNNRQIDAEYHARAGTDKNYSLNPYGMVIRDGVVYLVACADDKPEPVHFALHRFDSAVLTDRKSNIPKNFDLSDYVEGSQTFSYPKSGKKIQLKIRIDGEVAKHLAERPLSTDQKLRFDDDGDAILTAHVHDTSELRWWLLGFGSQVEVLSPRSLRKAMAEESRLMHHQYAS